MRRGSFAALLRLEAMAFRRATAGLGVASSWGRFLAAAVADRLSFLVPLLIMGGVGWVFMVGWQYGSVFTNDFLALTLLFFVLLGYVGQNMSHLVHAHQGNLLMRSLPLPNGAFARAKFVVLILFGAAGAIAYVIPGLVSRARADLVGSGMAGGEVAGAVGGVVTGIVAAALYSVFTLSISVLVYRAGWGLRPLRPWLSTLLSLAMVGMLAGMTVWTSTGFTQNEGLYLGTEPGDLTWWLPPSWFAALMAVARGRGQLQHVFAASGAVAATALAVIPALHAMGSLLAEEDRGVRATRGGMLWPAFTKRLGALVFLFRRHMVSEPRMREGLPAFMLISFVPMALVWYRPGEMEMILSPRSQLPWTIDLHVGMAFMISFLGSLTAAMMVHHMRYARAADGGLRFLSLPVSPWVIHEASVLNMALVYLGPLVTVWGVTEALIFWGIGPLKIKYLLAMIAHIALDPLLVVRADTLLNPALPMSRQPDAADLYPAWLSLYLPAAVLAGISGAAVRAFYISTDWFVPMGVIAPAVKLILLIATVPLARRRLASLTA